MTKKLTELVPHELCVELVTRCLKQEEEEIQEEMADVSILDQTTCDDPVKFAEKFVGGRSDETEEEKEYNKKHKATIISLIEKLSGKTWKDVGGFLPPASEEIAKEIEEEVRVLESKLMNDWWILLSMIHSEITENTTRNWILLGLQLLPLGEPTDRFKEDLRFEKCKTWYEVFESGLANIVNKEDLRPIFKAFVDNVIRETKETGRLELFDGLVIHKGFHLYYLSSE